MPEGILVAVVGPSGAGKDSLIRFARDRLQGDARYLFVRRVVTRDGNVAEDHDTLSVAAFEAARLSGRFAVSWQAHGLRYGIPAAVHAHLDAGGVAVVNGSRAALPQMRLAFPALFIVSVTARPDVLARRLGARGRESEAAIAERVARGARDMPVPADAEIDNSGDLERAGDAFLALLCALQAGI